MCDEYQPITSGDVVKYFELIERQTDQHENEVRNLEIRLRKALEYQEKMIAAKNLLAKLEKVPSGTKALTCDKNALVEIAFSAFSKTDMGSLLDKEKVKYALSLVVEEIMDNIHKHSTLYEL